MAEVRSEKLEGGNRRRSQPVEESVGLIPGAVFQLLTSDLESLPLVGEHSVESDGRPRGLLNATEETLPA